MSLFEAVQAITDTVKTCTAEHECFICHMPIGVKAKRPHGWYAKLIKTFGKRTVRSAFGKHGHRGLEMEQRFTLFVVGGVPTQVPVCSVGCRNLASLLYQEDLECQCKVETSFSVLKKQLDAVQQFLKTGNREAWESLKAESVPDSNLLPS